MVLPAAKTYAITPGIRPGPQQLGVLFLRLLGLARSPMASRCTRGAPLMVFRENRLVVKNRILAWLLQNSDPIALRWAGEVRVFA